MRFDRLLHVLGVLISISCSTNALANHHQLPISLNIKPMICVVKKAGNHCQMTITARWQSPKPIDACLYQEQQKLSCWQQQKQVKQTLAISLNKDITFTLTNTQGKILASQKVKINLSQSQLYRRRLRAQWSLF